MIERYHTIRGVRMKAQRAPDRGERIWQNGVAIVLFIAAILATLKMLTALLLPS